MSVTSGFYNSLNGDRRYNAEQMSALFDTIINDGVFTNVGTAFEIKSIGGMNISVGIGRAWFNSTWLYNDAVMSLTVDASEVLLNRYDAVVLEINHNEAVRAGSIKLIKGTPSSNPQFPAMTNKTEVHQHPLAYIYVKAGATEITQADITNQIGTSACPYITGILQVQNIDKVVAQWMAEWDQLTEAKEEEFNEWFATIKAILDDDVATQLLNRVVKLEDGTTPAGDSNKLGGEPAEVWQGKIDRIQTTSSAARYAVGWYRIAKHPLTTSNVLSDSCFIELKRTNKNSSTTDNEVVLLRLDSSVKTKRFSVVSSLSALPLFMSIRYTTDSDNAYLEVMIGTSSNFDYTATLFDIANDITPWEKVDFEATEETVEGVTITTTYDIPANAKPVTDLDITNNSVWNELTSGFDLNNALGKYRTVMGTVVATLLNLPVAWIVGEVSVEFIPFNGANKYGVQILTYKYGAGVSIYQRSKNDTSWGTWEKQATTADLANYQPLIPKHQIGNSVDELLAIYDNIHNQASDKSEYTVTIFHNVGHPVLGGGTWLVRGYRQAIGYGMQTAYSYMNVRVRFMVAGTWTEWMRNVTTADLANYLPKTGGETITLTDRLKTNRIDSIDGKTLYEYTTEQNIIGAYNVPTRIRSLGKTDLTHYVSEGALEYVILDSGNVGSYALPVNGGGEVQAAKDTPIVVYNTTADSTEAYMGYKANSGGIKYMGFKDGEPCIYGKGNIHYDGNSAKVAIQESAPTDTTALWVY